MVKSGWREARREAAVLYVDGHVRVYYGNTKQLPKHYIARERLCLSATADYWVNAMDGKPFFVMSQAVDPGLLQVLATSSRTLEIMCRTNQALTSLRPRSAASSFYRGV